MTESTAEEPVLDHGPVEIMLIEIEGDPFDERLWQLVGESIDRQQIQILDAAVVRRLDDETVEFVELDQEPTAAVSALELLATGLLADEDLEELAADVETGSSAVVIAFEHVWARALASRLLEIGGAVVGTQRIPAPVVQVVFDALSEDSSETEGTE
jgi:hypothetical protein